WRLGRLSGVGEALGEGFECGAELDRRTGGVLARAAEAGLGPEVEGLAGGHAAAGEGRDRGVDDAVGGERFAQLRLAGLGVAKAIALCFFADEETADLAGGDESEAAGVERGREERVEGLDVPLGRRVF